MAPKQGTRPDAGDLRDLTPGAIVRLRLRMDGDMAYADGIQVVRYQSVEQALTARRLRLLRSASAPAPLAPGDAVPDVMLTNQARRLVALSQFRGKPNGLIVPVVRSYRPRPRPSSPSG